MSNHAHVKVDCSTCGEVQVCTTNILLMLCFENMEASSYAFNCPKCSILNEHPVNQLIISILVRYGVQHAWVTETPPEVAQPPAIPDQEVLDFLVALDKHDALGSIAELEGQP